MNRNESKKRRTNSDLEKTSFLHLIFGGKGISPFDFGGKRDRRGKKKSQNLIGIGRQEQSNPGFGTNVQRSNAIQPD